MISSFPSFCLCLHLFFLSILEVCVLLFKDPRSPVNVLVPKPTGDIESAFMSLKTQKQDSERPCCLFGAILQGKDLEWHLKDTLFPLLGEWALVLSDSCELE